MDINEVKTLILNYRRSKTQRDEILSGVEEAKSNPMSLIRKMGDIEQVLELTKEMEQSADTLFAFMIGQIQEQEVEGATDG